MTKQSQNDLDNHYPMNCRPSAAISNGPTFQVERYTLLVLCHATEIYGGYYVTAGSIMRTLRHAGFTLRSALGT